MSVAKSRHQIATEIAKSYTREGTGYADRLYQLGYAIEAALKERDERAAKVLETRANELQTEWDAPPSAENGFIEMTADTPAGYATWYSMGQLRKLATTIREDTPVKRTNDEVQCADCGTWIKRDVNHTCKQTIRRNRRHA